MTVLYRHCGGALELFKKQGVSLAPDLDQSDIPLDEFYTRCARTRVSIAVDCARRSMQLQYNGLVRIGTSQNANK